MVSNSQKIAVKKYRQEKRDQLAIDIPKGKKDVYKATAARVGWSLATLVQIGVERLIAQISHEAAESLPPMSSQPQEKLSDAEKRLVEDFKTLSPKSQKALREIISELLTKKGGD